jgi:hypothetical protein
MSEPSILDARLAEIDQRLRSIQSGLAPASEPPLVPPEAAPAPTRLSPPPPRPSDRSGVPEPAGVAESRTPVESRTPAESSPPEGAALVAGVEEIIDAHEKLLASARDLLRTYSDALAGPVGVSAGPFEDTAALKRFERSLAALPEVREVVVREYEGEDRAIVDVHLFGATS